MHLCLLYPLLPHPSPPAPAPALLILSDFTPHCLTLPLLLLPLPSCPSPSTPLAQRVMEQEEDSALLKAYIAEWSKYFTQCSFLPMPFQALETAAGATKFHKKTTEGNRVYTVSAADCRRSYVQCIVKREKHCLGSAGRCTHL